MNQQNRLQVTSILAGVEVETRELVSDWLLITYDIPKTEAGDKARREFLREARRMGAHQHTSSVYLLPWTVEAEIAVIEVASIGKAFVWFSPVKDEAKAGVLTRAYDREMRSRIRSLDSRIDRIGDHWRRKRKRLAIRMLPLTITILQELTSVIARRGSIALTQEITASVSRLDSLLKSM